MKPQVSQETINKMIALRQAGHKIDYIAVECKVSPMTVTKYTKDSAPQVGEKPAITTQAKISEPINHNYNKTVSTKAGTVILIISVENILTMPKKERDWLFDVKDLFESYSEVNHGN